ncbi:MAG TPA: S-adenosylmethionine:tRNA ribosyltransferase-isomerase [Solirubrobacteraceae bacterium]|jgi:S-adenosylmethionine:tRNA ribosyltransferase-isomerase
MTALAFELPPALEAPAPPEARGLARDEVRLMVAQRSREELTHARFRDLPDLLEPGDLLVVNISATLAAALPGRRKDGADVRVHVASRAPGLPPSWRVIELRSADGSRPASGRAGETIALPGGAEVELVARYASGARLALGRFHRTGRSVESFLALHGAPIRYGYVERSWPLDAYQTVFATTPGSAEMPSAARPFSSELLARLLARGVLMAPLTLHAGLSSPERHEQPIPELFKVPEATARLVSATRSWGGRVVAVGTTVVRALESAAVARGDARPKSGWTGLVVSAEQRLRVVDGLITGWHEPEASHLQLLEAVAGRPLLERCYREALEHRYLWHEFGDSHLILP